MGEARLDADGIVARTRDLEDADGHLPLPDVVTWDIFPWEGDLATRPLRAPGPELPPHGESGPDDCRACAASDAGAIWADDRWHRCPGSHEST